MKKYISILSVGVLIFFTSCRKSGEDVLLDEQFTDWSSSPAWDINGGGGEQIVSGYIKFYASSSCCTFEYPGTLYARKKNNYRIRLRSKHTASIAGDTTFCDNDFMIRISQNEEELLFDGPSPTGFYTTDEFYFKTIADDQIKIEFVVGTVYEVWVDYIIIEKE